MNTKTNRVLGVTILVALVIVALIALSTYEMNSDLSEDIANRAENVGTVVEEAATNAQSAVEQATMQAEKQAKVVVAVGALQMIRSDILDDQIDEGTFENIAKVKTNIQEAYDKPDEENQEILASIQNDLTELEQMLRNPQQEGALDLVESLIQRLENFSQDEEVD